MNAETNGTAAFTYENSSGGADQYTLTATPDELYVFDYWSWEGVPTGAENSAPEEQALPVDARETPSIDFEGHEDLFSGRGCTRPSRISGSTMPRT